MATPRKPPSKFALERGRLMKRAREEAGWSQELVRQKLGLESREVVSQYEHGKIEEISEQTCRAIVYHLGLLPEQVAEDPSVFQLNDLPEVSSEARRVARGWDDLDDHVRQFVLRELDKNAKQTPKPRTPDKLRR